MKKTNNNIDSLPEEFSSDEEAAEFWDTHSITDYEELLEPADLEFNLKRRHFEIEVDEESFIVLRASAKKQQKSVKHLASEVLKEKLRAV